MTNIIAEVRKFTEAVGCTTDRYNVRQTALYIGLQLEEMAEKLDSMNFLAHRAFQENAVALNMKVLSDSFKSGNLDRFVEQADRAAMLDADIDLAWVTIGSALSQGADVEGAAGEVARANMSKLVQCKDCDGRGYIRQGHAPDDYFDQDCADCNGIGLVAIKDENGKVCKPSTFSPPNIEPFINKGEAK